MPLLGFSQINSQKTNTANTLGVGFDVGITTFFGDIDEAPAKGDYMNNIAYRISLRKNLGYWFFLEGQVLVGNLSGEKKSGTSSYLYFHNDFAEYSLNADINVISLFTKNPNPKFNLCLGGGAGIITFNSKLYNGNDNIVLDSDGYEAENSSSEVSIIGSIKIAYNISNSFYLLGQTSHRVIDTDLLDSKEGYDKWDIFNYTSIGLIYKIDLNPSSKNSFSGYGKYDNKKRGKNSKSACATFN